MKIWKKLMVVGVAVVLVSTAVATQYMSIETGATLGINTKTTNLQIAGHDPAVGNESANTLLTDTGGSGNSGNTYELQLGTWGTQNNFTSTESMLLVNGGSSEIKITGCSVNDGGSGIADDINIYLHDGTMTPDNFEGTSSYLKAWSASSESSPLSSGNAVYLGANETNPYDGDTLTIMEDSENGEWGNATWGSSGTKGGEQWYYNYSDGSNPNANGDFAWYTSSGSTTNAVWVYICLNSATLDETTDAGTITFDVESV